MKAAHSIVGNSEAETAFSADDFVTKPLYLGKPWFLPMVYFWYGLKDRMGPRTSCRLLLDRVFDLLRAFIHFTEESETILYRTPYQATLSVLKPARREQRAA